MEFKSGLGSSLENPNGYSIRKEKLFIRNLQNELPAEPQESDTITNGSKNRVENVVGCHEEVNDKIHKALKSLRLREKCNLVQFWAPCSNGNYILLKTVDQPFHQGKPNNGLSSYRRESERNWFLVDEKCEEEDLIPVARVFRTQLPEWTSDVMNYYSKKYPLQDFAIRLNLHGYLVLPVFDPNTMTCVGVLEFITYLSNLDCAYEVQEVHRTLKAVNLISPQAFDCPASNVNSEYRKHELDEIFTILKELCDTYSLPLAQTWVVSSWSSYTAVGDKVEKTCSCFNSSCIGKVCMSSTSLPFYVPDLQHWNFRKACREHHLLTSQGVVGRALSSHGSSFCPDVTELGEEEYPLVHNARMSGLRGCFAIYLNSREHDHSYVLEFFLPVDMRESAELQNMMQKLKMHIRFSSFECGDQAGTEVIGRAMEVSQQSLSIQLNMDPTSMSKEIIQLDLEDSQTVGETSAQNDCISSQDPYRFTQVYRKNLSSITNSQKMSVNDVSSKKIDVPTEGKGFTSAENGVFVKQSRKHKTDSPGSEQIQKYIEKLINEASLGDMSREILNSKDSGRVHEFNAETAFCVGCPINWKNAITKRENMFVDDATSKKIDFVSGEAALMEHRIKPKSDDLIAEHKQKYSEKPTDEVSRSFGSLSSDIWQLSQNEHDLVNSYHKNWSSAVANTEEIIVADVLAAKSDVGSVENGCNSERKGAYTRRRRKRKMDSITQRSIQQYFGKPIAEASTRLGVSRSTLKRVCRELDIPRWPFPQRNKKHSHFSISVVIRLLIRIKRWSCSTSQHGFSAKWWICGKHNAFAAKSNQLCDSRKGESICERIYLSKSLKESDDCIETLISYSKPQQACFGIYEAACLLLGLKRWRKRTLLKHATQCNDYLIDDGHSDINIFNVFPYKNMVYGSETCKVTVKAAYKDDIVKFDFPFSLGLSKLKNQVAQRIKLQATRFHLKYKDEDDDLILITCDEDLCSLVPFSATSASHYWHYRG
uniref:protein NLP6-like n=1 Tax=Erigeron canadensis TaxID=72917 RepID=UPI001CB89BB2|nr:protein NLP6-like [Erigeron canadensis]